MNAELRNSGCLLEKSPYVGAVLEKWSLGYFDSWPRGMLAQQLLGTYLF